MGCHVIRTRSRGQQSPWEVGGVGGAPHSRAVGSHVGGGQSGRGPFRDGGHLVPDERFSESWGEACGGEAGMALTTLGDRDLEGVGGRASWWRKAKGRCP